VEKPFHQRLHLAQVSAVPLRRNLAGRLPYCLVRNCLDPRQPGLKGLPPGDLPVDFIAVIDTTKWRILELPLPSVKAVPEVDEDRPVAPLPLLALEDRRPKRRDDRE